MRRILILLSFVSICYLCADATCHTVLQSSSCTGAGCGANWNTTDTANGPFTNFPASGSNPPGSGMVRGDTYYVGTGAYCNTAKTTTGGCVFNATDSGTSLITVLPATSASHCTASGWNASTMATDVAGQVVFNGKVWIESDYWTFNGVQRGVDADSLPRSGYLLKFNNNNGSNAPIYTGGFAAGDAPVVAAVNGNAGNGVSNVTLEYLEIAGSGDTTGTYTSDWGVWFTGDNNGGIAGANNYLGYSYVHDTGGGSVYLDSTSGFILEHNWVQNNQGTSVGHAEGLGIRATYMSDPTHGVTSNLTVRYNYFENLKNCGFICTPKQNDTVGGTGYWDFYGNVFLYNSAEQTTTCGPGQLADFFGFVHTGTIHFYNNTFANLGSYTNSGVLCASGTSTMSPGFVFGIFGQSCTSGQTSVANGAFCGNIINIQNNLWYNSAASTSGNQVFNPCNSLSAPWYGTCTYSYNAHFGTFNTNEPGNEQSNAQNAAGVNPFVNVAAGSAGVSSFALSTDTTAWTPLSSPFNTDIVGNTRTSSRGAFQYMANDQPGPPTGLSATVQ